MTITVDRPSHRIRTRVRHTDTAAPTSLRLDDPRFGGYSFTVTAETGRAHVTVHGGSDRDVFQGSTNVLTEQAAAFAAQIRAIVADALAVNWRRVDVTFEREAEAIAARLDRIANDGEGLAAFAERQGVKYSDFTTDVRGWGEEGSAAILTATTPAARERIIRQAHYFRAKDYRIDVTWDGKGPDRTPARVVVVAPPR